VKGQRSHVKNTPFQLWARIYRGDEASAAQEQQQQQQREQGEGGAQATDQCALQAVRESDARG